MHLSKEIDHRLLGQHRYVLVDAGYLEDPTQWLPKEWPALPAVVVRPSHLSNADVDVCPRLVDIQPLTQTQRGAWLQNIQEQSLVPKQESLWYWSAFIDSPYSLEKLAEQLARRMQIILPSSSTPQLFRYFDPAIMVNLSAWLDQVGLAWLLFGLNRYTYFFANQWCSLTPPVLDEQKSIERVGYRLSATLLERLLRLSVVNRALDAIHPAPDTQEAWRTVCLQLDAAVVRAEHHGLVSREEKIAFALDSYWVGKDFDRHPVIEKKLRSLKEVTQEDELNYCVLRQQLTAEAWEQIKRDLWMESV